MQYISTRGGSEAVSSAEAIKKGLAPDGGLYLPEELPTFTSADIKKLTEMDYASRAALVLGKFLTDYTEEELKKDCGAAYANFSPSPAPLHRLNDDINVLELWHGPTCAFKDMALQIMPKLLSRALGKTDEKSDAFILVATSGDTGKAALEGYKDADRIKIMVFYPVNGVSRIQKLQMATQEGNNVAVCSVVGNFDDAQNGVKRIFSDRDAAGKLLDRGYVFSSANSINWGRLAPQIAYYISAYCDMIKSGEISNGDEINICVPTGNFGNILAGYIAKLCGLPFGRFVCASNSNNVLTDFFDTGVYDRTRRFFTTMSPSMDILISSNLERLLYMKSDAKTTGEYMKQLKETGRYSISPELFSALKKEFTGLCCSEEETSACIKDTFEKYGYLIDTHTAVGLSCAQRYIAQSGDSRKMLTVSTASPYKFASSVYRSLTGNAFEDEFRNLDELSALTSTQIPYPLASLRSKEVRFDPDKPINPENMLDAVFSAAE